MTNILRHIGQTIDRHYLKKVGATVIPGSSLGLLLLCYHPLQSRKAVVLEDTVCQLGAMVGEFHLSNIRITELAGEKGRRSLEWRIMALLKEEFTVLAKACVAGVIPETVQGFYGVNVLVAGAKRLGFTLLPIPPGWSRWWLGFWESCLRLIFYSYKTKKKAALQRTMDPYEVWISRTELIRRYYQE
ncbi:MAG: hypothetical protein PVH64_10000 [Bacillota bacterium]|jgi:hypothetical protein